ncbi:MAG: ATPase [Mucilaginibacter sp.]|nr:ATPase [Mucilaginibacter sp.]
MTDKEIPLNPIIDKTIIINALPSKVWDALTNPELMKQWMSETPIDIITDWKVGNSITIGGAWYKTRFENKGMILQFESERHLQYNHLSSLSRLPDKIENYSIIGFKLTPKENQTALTLTLSNFPTEIIYKHLAFYWNVTLEILKKQVEQ